GRIDRSAPARKQGATVSKDVNTAMGEFGALVTEHGSQGAEGESLSSVRDNTPVMCPRGTTPLTGSPKWSQVVKRHHRQHKEPVVKSACCSGPTLGRREGGKTIVVTGAPGNISW
ncbi:hypothetical protein GOODEAATRI_033602, partial [Goodea atripinnis]